MSPKPRRAGRAPAANAAPRLPRLIHNRVGRYVYGVVRWKGRSYSLGRVGDPELDTRHRAWCAHLLAHGTPPADRGEDPQLPSYLVAELVAHYLEHCESYYRHLADGTVTASVQRVRAASALLLELFASLQARSFDVGSLRVYRDRLVAQGHARTTINTKVRVVKQMFTWAGEEGRLPPDVGLRLRVLKPLQRGRSKAPDRPRREPVAWEDVEPVLPFLPTPVAGIVQVLRWSAARCGEVCQLRGRDVATTGDVWEFRPRRHKGQHHGKDRVVFLGAEAQAVLRPFVRLDPDAFWFSPADAVAEFQAKRREERETPCYPSHMRANARKRKQSPRRAPRPFYDSNAVAKAIAKAIAAANAQRADEHAEKGAAGDPPLLPTWSAHQLRHAALSRVREKHGAEAALAIGGHGSLAMTEHYTDSARRELAKAAARASG